MSEEKFFHIQNQVRQNQVEVNDFLRDLDSWSTDIKAKEEQLKNQKPDDVKLPPVRNSLLTKKKRKKPKKKGQDKAQDDGKAKPKKISGYDFRAWDKYDVDKACEEVEKEDEGGAKSSSSEYETDEEWEVQRKKQQALHLKDEGNQFFKEGRYDEAIECYTRGINCDPSNALLSANRAMALLKQQKYGAAELDCTAALSIDPTYVKAYSRRGTARLALKKLKEAKEDFQQVLQLEPSNKQAKGEMSKIERLEQQALGNLSEADAGLVKAIHKPPHKRSKKPLRRVQIEEVGVEESAEVLRVKEQAKSAPSQTGPKQQVTAKDEAKFEQFLHPGQIASASSTTTVPPVQVEELNTQSGSDIPQEEASLSEAPACKEDIVKDTATKKSEISQSEERETGGSESSPKVSPRVPPVPTSSFQFQTDCKALRHASQQFYQYFKSIPPANFSKLFGQSLDSDILLQILLTLKDHYMKDGLDLFPVLLNLTKVKRFSMTAMFLSSKDKQMVKQLIDHLQSSEAIKSYTKEETKALTKAYGV